MQILDTFLYKIKKVVQMLVIESEMLKNLFNHMNADYHQENWDTIELDHLVFLYLDLGCAMAENIICPQENFLQEILRLYQFWREDRVMG